MAKDKDGANIEYVTFTATARKDRVEKLRDYAYTYRITIKQAMDMALNALPLLPVGQAAAAPRKSLGFLRGLVAPAGSGSGATAIEQFLRDKKDLLHKG